MDNQRQEFKKLLGRWDSIAIIIAIVIGVGIFRVPAEVAKYLASPNLVIMAWLAGGIISLLGVLCYAELSTSFPKTGGDYVYLRESYGRGVGFLYGWTELSVVRTGSIAAVSFIFAEYFQSFLSLDKSLVKPVAVATVLILSFVNIFGLHYGKKMQNAFVITKLLALAGIVVFGFMSNKGNLANFQSVSPAPESGIFQIFGLALIPILWTYGGWHENTFMAEETANARKALPLISITAIIIVTAFYLIINFLYIYLIPPLKIANATLIASDMLQILYGEKGRKILDALVIISSLGCINAMILTGSRITYAMAKDNAFFRYIGKIDDKYGTPHRAIIINGTWSIVLIILGTFDKLLFFTGILVWLFLALVAGGIFVLRYKFPDIERPYYVWGYPIVPIIFILICMGLFVNTAIVYPFQSLMGMCLLLGGVPLYLLSQRRKRL